MKRKIGCLIGWAALLLLTEYVLLVPLNLKAVSFWVLVLCFGTMLLLILNLPAETKSGEGKEENGNEKVVILRSSFNRKMQPPAGEELNLRLPILFGMGGAAFLIAAWFFSSPLFHAKNYASTIGEIQTISFEEARPEVDSVSNIALIDTATASRIGARELGSLEDVVSQFDDGAYTQITYRGKVRKDAVVDYDGFFKYLNNRKNGTPGYLIIDPISGSAELIRTETGIYYTPGAYFSKDILRHIRMQYPLCLFGRTSFEIDEDGKPFWVTQIQKNQVFLRNPKTTGIILTSALTGESQRYTVEEVPEWVDTVFDGDYVCEKYDYYGMLSGGFWNSRFGKRGCRISTKCSYVDEDGERVDGADFGYISDDRDIWIYTGVTSATSQDRSDIGMLMVNGRTGEAVYMTLAGADESSAMAAAEGELQQYGYTASFPSIINVDGAPAYIMVMTDNNRIVKNYAMVNMQNYAQVVTGDTQNEVFRKYRKLVSRGKEGASLSEDGVKDETLSQDKILSALYGTDEGGHFLELTFQDGSAMKYYMAD